jgi:hypothetical protein
LSHVQGIGDPDHTAFDRVGLAAPAVPDDRVQDLRDHHGPIRLLVDIGQQRREPVGSEEEAELLVILAMDRHPDIVEEGSSGNHYLGVPQLHPVVGDHRGLYARLGEEPHQSDRHVEDHLHVHPGVVGHPEPLRGHLGHVPPGSNLLVGIDGLEELLEFLVAPGRSVDLCLAYRLGSGLRLLGLLCHETIFAGGRSPTVNRL